MSLEKKMVTLKSSNEETFEIEVMVTLQSQTIKHLVEDNCVDNGIPLPNVTGATLGKVLEYCKKHAEEADQGADLNTWDTKYMNVDTKELYDILMAVNYLSIKGLLDLMVDEVANMIKAKSLEAIRKTFNITNDFPPDEEEKIRVENSWAFECSEPRN